MTRRRTHPRARSRQRLLVMASTVASLTALLLAIVDTPASAVAAATKRGSFLVGGLKRTVAGQPLAIPVLAGRPAVVPRAASALDPRRIPALARRMLPAIYELTVGTCPAIPPAWVVAQIKVESNWNPAEWSNDGNGGTAGLFQLNEQEWTAAGGRSWRVGPHRRPPLTSDVLQPERAIELGLRVMCAHLQDMEAYLAASGQPVSPLDAMLVCHVAGCGRVRGSASGVPQAGEAGCSWRCSMRVRAYIANVHDHIDRITGSGPAPDLFGVGVVPGPDRQWGSTRLDVMTPAPLAAGPGQPIPAVGSALGPTSAGAQSRRREVTPAVALPAEAAATAWLIHRPRRE